MTAAPTIRPARHDDAQAIWEILEPVIRCRAPSITPAWDSSMRS
ncbi:MAG TPA: hypothetical protein VFP36_14370 [Usitatibacter sp.]|nr:hypothetical protein [Usitatibacter sp.]